MVRLTRVLCRTRYAQRQREEYKRKGVYKVNPPPTLAHEILKESSVPIADPITEVNPPEPEWIPPSDMLPDFRVKFPQKEKPPGKHQVWHLASQYSFTEGINQACLLTKTQRFNGLPQRIAQLVNKYSIKDQDDRVRDAIYHAVKWNNTQEKLPKRIDPRNAGWILKREYGIPASKSSSILLTNLVRLCQSMSVELPALNTRRLLYKPSVELQYDWQGERIEINAINEYMLTDREAMKRLGNTRLVQDSAKHEIFDMFPIAPTVDLEKCEREVIDGTTRGALVHTDRIPTSYPHIVFHTNKPGRRTEVTQAYNLMTTFAIAVSEARNRYKIKKTSPVLTEPVTVLNINMSVDRINYLVFELNTLDLTSNDGVKNFAWLDSESLVKKTYNEPWLEKGNNSRAEYSEYNRRAFKKFLAMYLYGKC